MKAELIVRGGLLDGAPRDVVVSGGTHRRGDRARRRRSRRQGDRRHGPGPAPGRGRRPRALRRAGSRRLGGLGDRQPGGRGGRRHHRRRHAHRLGPAHHRCRRRRGEAGRGREGVTGRLRVSGVGSSRRTCTPSGRCWTAAWWASRRSCATAGGRNSPPATPTRWPGAWRRPAEPGFRWRSTAKSRPSSWAEGRSVRWPRRSRRCPWRVRPPGPRCPSPRRALFVARRGARGQALGRHDGRDLPPLPGAQPGRRAADRVRRGVLPSRPRGGRPSAHGGARRRRHDRQRGVGPLPLPTRAQGRTNPLCRRVGRRDDALGPALPGVSGSPVAPRRRAAPRRGRGAVPTGAQGCRRAGIRRRSGPRRRGGTPGRWRPRRSTAATGARRSSAAPCRVSWSPPSSPASSSTRRVVQAAEPSGRFLTPGVPGCSTPEKERS